MTLSIIIPIYNAEKTLQRCLDSILSQSFSDYEILLVDDGSIDNSGKMADEYAMKDYKIKVFHKANGGLSDARNYALDKVQGEYITFIDSDDEITPDTLPTLMQIIMSDTDYDILEYPVIEKIDGKNIVSFNPCDRKYKNSMDWLAEYGFEHCWVCNKIYRKSLFNNIRFKKGKTFEDVYLMGDLLQLNPIIYTTDNGKYIYHIHKDSIMDAEKKKGLTMLLEAQINVVRLLNIDTNEKKWHRLYFNMLTSQLHSFCITNNIILWNQRISIRKYVRFNDCIKVLLFNILGLKRLCHLFKILKTKSI